MSKSQLNSLLALHEETMEATNKIASHCPWENKDFYIQWCAQSYYFVIHATRILATSASRLMGDKDLFHFRFLDHCQEEKFHEKLYENDVKFLGADVHDYPEHPLTSLLYQNQYYLTERANPMAPMGGIFYLEGVSVYSAVKIYERCLKTYGEKACNFLRVHVHDDVDHIEKAKQILGQLDSQELTVVTQSYKQFSYCYVQLLQHLQATVMKKANKAA